MRLISLAPFGLLLVLTGCGPSTAPVSGRVTLDNKPLVNATVIFEPDSAQKNPGPGSQGKTNANGEYSLQLFTGEGKGAVLGKHIVRITSYEGDDGTIPSSNPNETVFRKPLLDEKYNAKSELKFEVQSGGSTTANFDLKSAAK
jgi:hypothetical protein